MGNEVGEKKGSEYEGKIERNRPEGGGSGVATHKVEGQGSTGVLASPCFSIKA